MKNLIFILFSTICIGQIHLNDTQKANINSIPLKANINSPTFIGVPTAPTPPANSNNTQIATTAFVKANAGTPFDATIDFNNANPNTAGTTFTPNTPANTSVLYVSIVDGSQWTFNGTAYVTAPIKDLYRDRGMPNTLMTLSGVASFSRTNFLKWTSKFFILGGGRGSGTLSTAGYYEIGMPPVGTLIQGVGGIANQTVSATGIDMRASSGSWSVLYYILNAGGQATVNANFRLAGWQSDFVVPDNWVMVAAYNADINTVKIGNGQILAQGADSTGAITPFDATIDFNNLNPNTAGTTFTPNTPANGNVIYVSSINGSQWSYNGTAYISAPANSSWLTAGNTSTNASTNFVGTTDNVALNFRTNNVIRQTISPTGSVGFGTNLPFGKTHTVLDSSNGDVTDWGAGQAVFGQSGSRGSGLAIGYNLAINESFISTLAPSVAWRPLRFLGAGWKFFVNGTSQAFTIATNSNIGINAPNPSTKLHIKSDAINDSGLRLENLNLSTPVTTASAPLAIDALGKVVISNILSGEYTPILSNFVNVVNPTVPTATYTKIGNIVTVRISFECNVTTANIFSSFAFTVPFPFKNSSLTTDIIIGSLVCSQQSSEQHLSGHIQKGTLTTARAYFKPTESFNVKILVLQLQYSTNL